MSTPSVLFNAAALDVVVAARPDLVASAPPSTSLANLGDADLASRTDAWVDALLKAPRRAALYHDERLQFHLVVSLPPPPPSPSSSSAASSALTRRQAAALLLDSLPTTAHLQIAADLAYVDPTTPPPLPQRTSSLHGARASASPVLARAPLTPAPDPAHAAASTPTREAHAGGANEVHIARAHPQTGGEGARVWVARGQGEGEWVGVWLLECDLPAVRTQLRDPRLAITIGVTLRDDPKLALLLDRAKDGDAPARSAAGEDALELGAGEADDDEEYMEDSYDDVNLLSALAPISSHPLHLPFSRLSSFSPQPPPSLPIPRSRTVSISHTRTISASSSTSSSSGDPSHRAAAHAHHPSLRRSVRRVLPLRPAVHIDLRAVPCPVGALGLADGQGVFAQHGAGVRGGGGGGGGSDEDEMGLVLSVEVRGAAARALSGGAGAEDAQDEAFVVDEVELVVEGAATPRSIAPSHAPASSTTAHDLEVRLVTRPTSTSTAPGRSSLDLRLAAGSPAQHNFVYALARIPGAPAGSLAAAGAGGAGAEAGAATSVPRVVALSPALALQGGGRFGGPGMGAVLDEEDKEEDEERGTRGERRASAGGAAGRSALERRVTVVVTGRPVVRRRRRVAQVGGYDVPDGVGEGEGGDVGLEREEDVDRDEAATAPFACRWHTTLDISSLAFPASRPHRAAFATQFAPATHPAATRPTSIGAALPFLPPSHAAGRLPLRPSPSTNVQVESVAGSKRHTMSSLAALSLRSPVLNRKSAGFAPPPSARPSSAASSSARALPPTPGAPPAPAPTPSLVGPAAKRFFSLPPGSAEPSSSASAASSTPHVATPLRTETPSPMHSVAGGATASGIGSAVAAAAKRVSLPSSMSGSGSAARLDARPKETRRTSWMSGLVPGGASSVGSGAPSPQPPAAGERTSWPAGPSSSTLGLGLDDPALAPQADGVAEQPRRLPAPPPSSQQQLSAGNLLISVSLVPLRTAKSRRAPFDGAGGDSASTGPSSTSTAAAAAATGRTNAHLPPAVLPGLAFSRAPSPAPVAAPMDGAAEPHATPRFAFPASQPPSGSPSPSASPLPSPPLVQVHDGEAALRAQAERTSRATSRMPRVNLLDVFLVEVFLFNHSDQVKRFTVGVGSAASSAAAAAGAGAGARRGRVDDDEKVARLVPLENDVRIGPLAPNSCASVGIRFLAIRPGAHVVEALRVVDLADGSETMLERPLWVVVE
ncbi:uncharacterized protein RHOBADRAFT_54561 [Rhodotorula graminis WP1]|uniref:Trafficking protein particle complex II-specific subunit 65 IgD3 domain-containing protein n=1 Tax=Rhodotorula graminis (strain WP1) TaxID=578459 RepID=A0A0P9EP47_RHOGW|nr:uncharacterized protein RHOBADRAFT_54561 [Rhodotorula graminis WP1]KPV73982.1 hypothetical protein RHOBADRAFT_54561 [Rhodotorula graminis WP1]